MPSKNKEMRPADLKSLIRGLCESGVEFILVGGLAAVAQGAPITTFDVDIVHRQNDPNIGRLLTFLKSIGAYQRRPDDLIIEPTEQDLKGKGHHLMSTRFGPLDVLAVIEKGYGFEDLLPETIEIEFQGYRLRVLNLEAILNLKRESDNPKDRYRLPILEETFRQTQDEKE